MTDRPTFCDECDGVHMATRKLHPSQWLCVHFKRLEGQGFVSRTEWTEQQPYMRCVGINGGACPLWTKRPDGQLRNGL